MPQPISYPGVYVEEGHEPVRRIAGVATSVAVFVGRAPRGAVAGGAGPVRLRNFSEFEREFGTVEPDWALGLAVLDFFANGGHEPWVARLHANALATADSAMGPVLQVADYLGDAAACTGLHALQKIDAFNLLCIPPDLPGGDIDAELWQVALALCVQRRAMLLVDPPAAWDATVALPDAQALAQLGLHGSAARNAALYFPRLLADGTPGAAPRAPCGAVAGIIACMDAEHGVWKAPAGLEATLQGLLPARMLGDGQQALLDPIAINCLRRFPQGTAVWGARTLAGADARGDAYKYVAVRRTALFLEDSLQRGLAWTVFEANHEALWARVRLSATAFLDNFFRLGAFQGRSPRDAYFVKCDAATTTRADVEAGILHLEVGFAPLKPAEFLELRIALQAASPGA